MKQKEIKEIAKNQKYGFLRETSEAAKKAGIDQDTGLFRTGLNEYLEALFPNTKDWIHDSTVPNCERKIRPDYRSESLKLIIEFDGVQHYEKPDIILNDKENTKIYEKMGYKVVRIPFFIQLSREAVKILFGVDVDQELFDERIPSFGSKGNTPAYFCLLGIKRCAEEFLKFPNQYEANKSYLISLNNEELTGIEFLDKIYQELVNVQKKIKCD